MTRSKRTAQVKAHITPELREQLELFVAEQGVVLSMSDYLFGVLEEHVAIEQARRKSPIRISHQRIARRIGEQ